MSERTSVEDRPPLRIPDERHVLAQRWHDWGSPIGLGIGLVCVGGFFVLLALGLSVLDSIG